MPLDLLFACALVALGGALLAVGIPWAIVTGWPWVDDGRPDVQGRNQP